MHHHSTSSLTSFILHFCDMAHLSFILLLCSVQYKTAIILVLSTHNHHHHHLYYYIIISYHDGTVHMFDYTTLQGCLHHYFYHYFTASICDNQYNYCSTTTHEQMWQEYSLMIVLGVYRSLYFPRLTKTQNKIIIINNKKKNQGTLF